MDEIVDLVSDRVVGCFRGLAVGDALGAPVEFKMRGSFEPVTEYRETLHFGLPAGYWTDDTSMALCLADSLIENDGYDSFHVMNKYLQWFENGYRSSTGECFDIGNQTSKALNRFKNFPKLDESSKSDSAGNGVLMRLAPAAIVSLKLSEDDSVKLFETSAVDTHNNGEAIESTVLFGMFLKNLLQGFGKVESFDEAVRVAGDKFRVADHVLAVDEDNVGNGGYVLTSFAAAWFAFSTSDSFEDTVLKAANLGGDADTIAAIAGQMAGAYYGDSRIPEKLKAGLHDSQIFVNLSEDLLQVTSGVLRVRYDAHDVVNH